MSNFNILTLKPAVRDFHVCRSCWQLQENELLDCFHELNNLFDMLVIQVCQLEATKKWGHLLMEISRTSKVLLDRGVK